MAMFELKTHKRGARPRSKRLREQGGAGAAGSGSTIVNVVGGGNVAGPMDHSHDNKRALDQISTDANGYQYLTRQKEVTDDEGNAVYEQITEKVKAGYADEAGMAHDLDPDSPVRDQFLSKLADDVAAGHITFEKGMTALILSYFQGGARFGNFVQALAGAMIDQAGNAEFESITSRGYLKVFELIYNRLNALEGDTSFAGAGTIETIEDGDNGAQVLTMRKRWDGDFTAFQPGDIVYGYVNNLDNGGASEYYKAWAWVKSVDRAANTLNVVPYADSEVPAGKNHPLTASMIITRRGNIIEANALTYANKEYSEVIAKRGDNEYVNVRQTVFYISCEDGNIVELMGVNKPILEAGNYGTVLGKIPPGLLDASTQELVNKDQPYLFARGIVVQDLIRIGYGGSITRTANYRGAWSAQTAASSTDYYRSTPGTYDTVTQRGDLWQCVVSGTTDEPSETTGDWVNMTGGREEKELRIWALNPTASIISVRKDEVHPETVGCTVSLYSSNNTTRTISSNYDLLQEGAQLFYSLDGLAWQEFIMGPTEPLDLEDGTGVIELEAAVGDNILTVGGDDVATSEIGDRIYFELRSAGTEETLAAVQVPVVKDGRDGGNGLPGRDGLMVYPVGYFDENTRYSATSETAPVSKYGDNFYALKRGATYYAPDMPDNRKTPAGDVAYGGSDARWQVFDKFNAIFADIIMADFAKLASAVFYGDYMISQQGIRNGEASTDYQYFRDGSFTPNFSVNFRTGEMRAANGVFSGSLRTSLRRLEESDAMEVGSATINGLAGSRRRIQKDLDLNVSCYSEIELPTDISYVGARITICESSGVYTRNLEYVAVVAQGGGIIGGIEANNAEETALQKPANVVRFLNGTVQFLGVTAYDGDADHPITKWMLVSACAENIYGYKM